MKSVFFIVSTLALAFGELTCLDAKNAYQDAECCSSKNLETDTSGVCDCPTMGNATTVTSILYWKRPKGVTVAQAEAITLPITETSQASGLVKRSMSFRPPGCTGLCSNSIQILDFETVEAHNAYFSIFGQPSSKDLVTALYSVNNLEKVTSLVPPSGVESAKATYAVSTAAHTAWTTEAGLPMWKGNVMEYNGNGFELS